MSSSAPTASGSIRTAGIWVSRRIEAVSRCVLPVAPSVAASSAVMSSARRLPIGECVVVEPK